MHKSDSPDHPSRLRRLFRFLFIALALFLIVWFVGVKWYAGTLLDREKKAWASSDLGSLESFTSKYPRTSDNASALRLEELSKPLGIEAAPHTAPKNRQPSAAQINATDPFLKAIGDYVAKDLMKPSIQKPNPEIRAFLEQHATEIDALRDHLLTADLPRWELEVEKGVEAPIPNLLGAMKLTKLLLVNAIHEELSGNSGAAWKNIEASWKLAKSNWERPELLSNHIALAVTRYCDVTARHMPAPVPAWRSEMTAFDLVKPFTVSVKGESYLLTRADLPDTMYDADYDADYEVPWWKRRALRPVAGPYIDLNVPEALALNRDLITRMKSTPLCDPDGAKLTERWSEIAPGNVVVLAMTPPYVEVWKQLVATKLGIELTDKVLTAKTLRAASPRGTWPSASQIPDIAGSSCKGRSWVYEPVGDLMSIKPSSPVNVAGAINPPPFEYRYEGAAGSNAAAKGATP